MRNRIALALLALSCSSPLEQRTRCPDRLIASDDFERADAIGLGTAPSGQQWIVSGPGYLAAQIESGRFTDGTPGNIAYAALFTAERPQRVGGRFSFAPGSGSRLTPIALISSSDPSLTLGHMLHLIVEAGGWRLTTWNSVAQDRPLAVEPTSPQRFPIPLRADGTVYEMWMTIRGDSVHLDLPEGMQADYRDPLVPELAGQQTIWELPYDAASASVPRWESVGVFAAGSCAGG